MAITTNEMKHILRTKYPEFFDDLHYLPHIFTEKSQIMIDRLLDEIQNSKTYVPTNILIERISSIPVDKDFSHIHPKIKATIEEELREHLYSANFQIGDKRQIKVYMAFHTKPSNKVLNSHIEFIYRWLLIADHYANPGCSPDLTIYIFFTHHKKEIENIQSFIEKNGEKKKVLNQYNVNTAFTFSCRPRKNTIYIYREEEWRKTFIHEIFHSFGLDFVQVYSQEMDEKLKGVFGLHIEYSLYEAYCEFWAELINILFYCTEQLINRTGKNDRKELYKKIESELRLQRTFSLIQSVKVLQYSDLTYTDLLVKPEKLKKYKEVTPLFTYHIVKSIMLFYMSEFIEWCMTKNRGSLQFHLKKGIVNEMIDWLGEHYDRTEIVETMIHIFAKNKHLDLPEPFLRTMRMTIL
jgi:hypothetical protein